MSWDDISDKDVPPAGQFRVKIRKPSNGFKCEASGNGKLNEGVVGRRVEFEIREPDDVAGMVFSQGFYVGTNDDPTADELETWKSPKNFAVKALKKMFKAAQVALIDRPSMLEAVDEMLEQAVDQELMVVTKNKESDGYENVNVKKWDQLGAFEPLITDPSAS